MNIAAAKANASLSDDELNNDYESLYRCESKLIIFIDRYFNDIAIQSETKKKTMETLKRNYRTKMRNLFISIAFVIYSKEAVKGYIARTKPAPKLSSARRTNPIQGNILERFAGTDATVNNSGSSNSTRKTTTGGGSGSIGVHSVNYKPSKKSANNGGVTTHTAGSVADVVGEGSDENYDFLNTVNNLNVETNRAQKACTTNSMERMLSCEKFCCIHILC
jgi:hypothetical protein